MVYRLSIQISKFIHFLPYFFCTLLSKPQPESSSCPKQLRLMVHISKSLVSSVRLVFPCRLCFFSLFLSPMWLLFLPSFPPSPIFSFSFVLFPIDPFPALYFPLNTSVFRISVCIPVAVIPLSKNLRQFFSVAVEGKLIDSHKHHTL